MGNGVEALTLLRSGWILQKTPEQIFLERGLPTMSSKRRRQLVESDSSSDEEDTFTFRYGEQPETTRRKPLASLPIMLV